MSSRKIRIRKIFDRNGILETKRQALDIVEPNILDKLSGKIRMKTVDAGIQHRYIQIDPMVVSVEMSKRKIRQAHSQHAAGNELIGKLPRWDNRGVEQAYFAIRFNGASSVAAMPRSWDGMQPMVSPGWT